MAIVGNSACREANRSVGVAQKLRIVLPELNCERDAWTYRGLSKMGGGRVGRGLCADETLRGQRYSRRRCETGCQGQAIETGGASAAEHCRNDLRSGRVVSRKG